MDRNFILACALSLLVITGWMYLTGGPKQHAPIEASPTGQAETPSPERASAVPTSEPDSRPLPQALPTAVAEQPAQTEIREREISIETPLYQAVLTNRGAGITSWKLPGFREKPALDAPVIDLVTSQAVGQPTFVTPFPELGIGDLSDRVFQVVREDASSVSFELRDRGITLRKTFNFDSDSYSFQLLIELLNDSEASIAPRFQIDMPAHHDDADDFRDQALAALEDGSRRAVPLKGLGAGGFFQSLMGRTPPEFKDFAGPIDWAGVQNTYFLTAIVPDNPAQAKVRVATLEPRVSGVAELSFDETAIPAGQSLAREFRGYMGPKEMERLEAFGGGTFHAIDLGWSWVEPLTRFFSAFLKMLYAVVANYGIAIIILTVLVRVVTAPLTIKQMRSMERMRALSPKVKEIQAEFADDRQKQSEKMMALYRSEGVNPLSGCLPMLLQFPVFIGLFYALRSTIQLRQAPFFGWINDLSVPESLFEIPGLGVPFRLLPLIMGASMVIQQRITPTQADPAQAKMMMTIMPIMMTVIFYQFPSGLVLYWMVSNILAISHQLWIGRNMRKGD